MRKKLIIEARKETSDLIRNARNEAKLPYCVICRKETTSFCQSHSVPRFILEHIAVNGLVRPFHYIDEPQLSDSTVGISKAQVFFNICRECDSQYFQAYESEEALSTALNNQVLAAIALKNHLLMYYKWRMVAKRNLMYSDEDAMLNLGNAIRADKSNERFSKRVIRRAKAVLDEKTEGDYILAYYRVLDWQVPICIQTIMTLRYNIDGSVLNNIFDYSPNAPVHDLHLCVFPLKTTSVILAFFHKDETNNLKWKKQFDVLSEDEKLQYLNYLVFCYTDNGFLSVLIPDKILRRKKLIDLCRENSDIKSLEEVIHPPKPVKPNDIPNFLTADFTKLLKGAKK